jgi:hypothetical protein
MSLSSNEVDSVPPPPPSQSIYEKLTIIKPKSDYKTLKKQYEGKHRITSNLYQFIESINNQNPFSIWRKENWHKSGIPDLNRSIIQYIGKEIKNTFQVEDKKLRNYFEDTEDSLVECSFVVRETREFHTEAASPLIAAVAGSLNPSVFTASKNAIVETAIENDCRILIDHVINYTKMNKPQVMLSLNIPEAGVGPVLKTLEKVSRAEHVGSSSKCIV